MDLVTICEQLAWACRNTGAGGCYLGKGFCPFEGTTCNSIEDISWLNVIAGSKMPPIEAVNTCYNCKFKNPANLSCAIRPNADITNVTRCDLWRRQ